MESMCESKVHRQLPWRTGLAWTHHHDLVGTWDYDRLLHSHKTWYQL